MHTTHPVTGDHVAFLDTLLERLRETGIQESEFSEIDHICYRVETLERYKELKEELMESETLASETEINGRPICIFKLAVPLRYKKYVIPALELPAPYAKPYVEGLQHAEFVVDDLEAFIARHSELPFVTKDLNKPSNPELGLDFPECSAKFHVRPILEVIRREKRKI